MKNYLILLLLSGALLLYFYWCFYLIRSHHLLWLRIRVKKMVFVFLLLIITGVQLYRIAVNNRLGTEVFWVFSLSGELLIKLSFMFMLGTLLTYYFLYDTDSTKRIYKVSRLLDIAAAIVSLGFVLFNLSTYVWVAEMLFLPTCFFLFSVTD